jgi:hypothetical protein
MSFGALSTSWTRPEAEPISTEWMQRILSHFLVVERPQLKSPGKTVSLSRTPMLAPFDRRPSAISKESSEADLQDFAVRASIDSKEDESVGGT